jgi:hypothetical protein
VVQDADVVAKCPPYYVCLMVVPAVVVTVCVVAVLVGTEVAAVAAVVAVVEGWSSDAVCGCVVPHGQPARADHLVTIGPTQNCK